MAEQDRAAGPPGFRVFADDTPRESEPPPRPLKGARRADAPSPELALWGEDAFPSIAPPGAETHARRRPARRDGPPVALAVAAIACAVGVGIGLGWARLKDRPVEHALAPAPAPKQTAGLADRAPTTAVSSARPPTPAAVSAAASPPRPSRQPGPVEQARPEPPPRLPAAPAVRAALPPAEASPATADAARDASAVARAPNAPSSDCADAGTLAGQLGCDDPAVAEAHRRMAAAYLRALQAGAPEDRLGADQARWLALRQRAALGSRQDLLSAYQQRTRDLEALGRSAPPQ